MSLRVYLAGPITGGSYDGVTSWRNQVIKDLNDIGIIGLSPMRGTDHLLGKTNLASSYEEHTISKGRAIVTQDRWDVYRADAILMNLLEADRVSIGTMIELAWADAARRPVVLAMQDSNPHDHAMVREMAGWIVPTLSEAVDVLKCILL